MMQTLRMLATMASVNLDFENVSELVQTLSNDATVLTSQSIPVKGTARNDAMSVAVRGRCGLITLSPIESPRKPLRNGYRFEHLLSAQGFL